MLRLLKNASQRPQALPGARHDEVAELVKAVRKGDARATRTFVTAVGPQLLRVVRRVLGRHHPDVEDVTQDAVYAVLEALPRYRGECTVIHFACRVGVLTAMNVRRRDEAAKRASLHPSEIPVESLSASSTGPDTSVYQRQLTSAVRKLLARLPEPQAEALALHCVMGCTVAEIAATSGASIETVRSRLRLAKHALRHQMQTNPVLHEIVGGAS